MKPLKGACEAFGKGQKRLEKRLQLFGKNLEKPLGGGSNEDRKEAVKLRNETRDFFKMRLGSS